MRCNSAVSELPEMGDRSAGTRLVSPISSSESTPLRGMRWNSSPTTSSS